MNQWIGFVPWLLVTFFAAWLGSQFEPGSWYLGLNLPAWTPPSWVFGPVWGVLYVLMAVAAWLVWVERGFAGARIALSLYFAQLTLNALWSWIFFGLHSPGWAAVEIVLLWMVIVMTLIAFSRVRALSAVLLFPYLLWVSYAVSLNIGIWWMNQ